MLAIVTGNYRTLLLPATNGSPDPDQYPGTQLRIRLEIDGIRVPKKPRIQFN